MLDLQQICDVLLIDNYIRRICWRSECVFPHGVSIEQGSFPEGHFAKRNCLFILGCLFWTSEMGQAGETTAKKAVQELANFVQFSCK